MVKAPVQQVAPLARQMAARNQTKRAEDTREEAKDLKEIDLHATLAKHRDEPGEEGEKLSLKIMETGSS